MTISVSVVSHAFFTERGVSGANASSCSCNPCSREAVSPYNTLDPQGQMKGDCIACVCTQNPEVYSTPTLSMHPTGYCSCREYAMSPRSVTAMSPSSRTISAASPSPRLMAVASPSPRTGGGKSQGKKKGHKKKGARKRAQDGESKEAKPMEISIPANMNRDIEGAQIGGLGIVGVDNRQTGACECCVNASSARTLNSHEPACMHHTPCGNVDPLNKVDVVLHDLREECSSALGIVKEDLELFGLCHVPFSSERATLLKDRSGFVHLGVMVRNSDLNLQSIEDLIVRKDKAEQEAESYRLQLSEKTQDLNNLKLRYDKLTHEVLRLRTMVNRANQLRRESEKATEILRVEFEKLVKTLFMDCSSQIDEVNQSNKDISKSRT